MRDATLTTTTPDGTTTTRPVPPWGASVAPLLERWQMALVPHPDRSWDVLAGWPRFSGSRTTTPAACRMRSSRRRLPTGSGAV